MQIHFGEAETFVDKGCGRSIFQQQREAHRAGQQRKQANAWVEQREQREEEQREREAANAKRPRRKRKGPRRPLPDWAPPTAELRRWLQQQREEQARLESRTCATASGDPRQKEVCSSESSVVM